jgi:hypothetical protein
MKYFQKLPKIVVSDDKGVTTIYTNIMARASIISKLLNDPMLFYTYDIQDGDTPEIVADKYYGDSYRYWLILFANQLLDPQWDWPLNSTNFNKYIADKYQEFDPYTEVYQFEKIVSQYDSATEITTVNKFVIDEYTYDNLTPTTESFSFPSGTTTITTSKNAKTYFEYEVETNEAKRNIKLLKKQYSIQIENEFASLMSQ